MARQKRRVAGRSRDVICQLERSLDMRFQSAHASDKKFNWCPVAPTIFQNEPVGQNVEAMSDSDRCEYINLTAG
jgi:hypothetical protein